MTNVTNAYGIEINFDAAVSMMNDEIREAVHAQGIESEQEFFNAYAAAHEDQYGEEWEMNAENPVW